MTIIDVAGATTGGAARWRREAECWTAEHPEAVRLIGLNRRVEPRWLVRREFQAEHRKIAANNVSFLTGCHRIVLLRNHLHFLQDGELSQFPDLPRNLSTQARVVRNAVRRAHVIVVPSTQMAQRVGAAVPSVAERITIRHHPLTIRGQHGCDSEPYVLFPSLPARHKDICGTLDRLIFALDRSGVGWHVRVTASPDDLNKLPSRLVRPIGHQSVDNVDALLVGASAVYAPFTAESFGYPIAEGRATGVPVIAPKTPHNQEIGGSALFPFDPARGIEDLAEALLDASKAVLLPDAAPFDPDAYFTWLTSL